MKFDKVFQFILILCLLLIWNVFHIGYLYQKDKYHNSLSQNPVLIFSRNNETLDSINVKIASLEYIRKTIVETDSLISNKLIETYDLYYARNILKNFKLPGVMKIYFRGEQFNNQARTHFEVILEQSGSNIEYHFDDSTWNFYRNRLQLLDNIYLYGNLVYLVFFLFITVFLRFHFEIKNDHYWKVFLLAGGRSGTRRKFFLINSVLISIIPFFLIFLLAHLAHFFQYLHFYVDLRIFAIEFAVLIAGCGISALILGERTR